MSVHLFNLLAVVLISCLIATFPQAAFIVQAAFFSDKVERKLFYTLILLNFILIFYTYKAALCQEPVPFEVIFLKVKLLLSLY